MYQWFWALPVWLLGYCVIIYHCHSFDSCLVGLVSGDTSDVIVGDRDVTDVTNLRKLLRILTAVLRVMTSVDEVTWSGSSDWSDSRESSPVVVHVLLDARRRVPLMFDGRSGGGGGVVAVKRRWDGPLAERSAARRRCRTAADGRRSGRCLQQLLINE